MVNCKHNRIQQHCKRHKVVKKTRRCNLPKNEPHSFPKSYDSCRPNPNWVNLLHHTLARLKVQILRQDFLPAPNRPLLLLGQIVLFDIKEIGLETFHIIRYSELESQLYGDFALLLLVLRLLRVYIMQLSLKVLESLDVVLLNPFFRSVFILILICLVFLLVELAFQKQISRLLVKLRNFSLLTRSHVLLMLDQLGPPLFLQHFLVLRRPLLLELIRIHIADGLLELVQCLRLELLPMQHRPQIIIPEDLILISQEMQFSILQVPQGSERILLVHVLSDFFFTHISSFNIWYFPFILWEYAQWYSGHDHNIGSTCYFF